MLGVRTERHACRKSKADRCDLTHVSLSFLNVALTKSSESRSLRLQHHAEVKRWSCSFRPWCRRAHRRAREGRQAPSFETVRLSTDASGPVLHREPRCRLSTAARPSFRSISRRINTPPFDDSFPPSNVAVIVFPPTGDKPGRNSVASVMVSGAPCWSRTVLFRQQNHT